MENRTMHGGICFYTRGVLDFYRGNRYKDSSQCPFEDATEKEKEEWYAGWKHVADRYVGDSVYARYPVRDTNSASGNDAIEGANDSLFFWKGYNHYVCTDPALHQESIEGDFTEHEKKEWKKGYMQAESEYIAEYLEGNENKTKQKKTKQKQKRIKANERI